MADCMTKNDYLKLVRQVFPEARGKAAERILYNWSGYYSIEKGEEIAEREFLQKLQRVRRQVEDGKPWNLGIKLKR